jgi:50S ribosome-binding GTPase
MIYVVGHQQEPRLDHNRYHLHAQNELVYELRHARLELEWLTREQSFVSPLLGALKRIETVLSRPVRLALMGEFNSGKTTLVNFLLGIDSLPTAVLSNTCLPTLLHYAAEPTVVALFPDGQRQELQPELDLNPATILRLEVGLPVERLKDVEFLDLPGIEDSKFLSPHETLAYHNVSGAIWCTVCVQAWKESENAAWGMLPDRLRANSILVATFADLLTTADDRRSVRERLSQATGDGFRKIVMLATLDARAGRPDEDRAIAAASWEASGASELEPALDDLVRDVTALRTAKARRLIGQVARRARARIGG